MRRVELPPRLIGQARGGKRAAWLLRPPNGGGTPPSLSTRRQVNFKIPRKKWRTPSQPRYPRPGMAYHSNRRSNFPPQGYTYKREPGPAAVILPPGFSEKLQFYSESRFRSHGSAWPRAGYSPNRHAPPKNTQVRNTRRVGKHYSRRASRMPRMDLQRTGFAPMLPRGLIAARFRCR